jgi:hypothetical protein
MRLLAALLSILAAPAAAAAQVSPAPLEPVLEAMRRDFPLDHRPLAASLAGKPPEEARRLAYAGIDRFLRSRRAAILAAPGPMLVSIEARQAALLRSLQKQDVALCATVGDRGFFSGEAAGPAAPPGLADYGVALIEAAKAGSGPAGAPEMATKEEFLAWLAAVEKIEAGVPVRAMLFDRELRGRSSRDHLCRGAAAMHEAIATLPPPAAERVARTLLSSVIGSSAP